MALTAELDDRLDSVETTMSFLVPTGEKLISIVGEPGGKDSRTGGTYEDRRVQVRNARPIADRFDFEREGFEFVKHETTVRDFYSEEEIRSVYYPEVEALIKKVSGAHRVVVFDHTVRTANDALRIEKKVREPVMVPHNDYTDWSAEKRLRDVLPNEADELLKRRFAIIQVWRPINRVVESTPLAMCDGSTMDEKDLVTTERHYQDRVGQTQRLVYNPNQRWYYFPKMAPNEALVFKVFDSLKDGRPRRSAHSAFIDPTSPADAPQRESIEIRTLAFF